MSALRKTQAQVFRFLIVSGVSLLIDSSVYILLTNNLDLSSSWAKRISFACIVCWGFIAHKRFTFRQKRIRSSELIKFGCLYLLGLGLNSLVHDLTASDSAASTAAFLTATAAWACLNFVGQKYFVFTAKAPAKIPAQNNQ